VSKSFLIDCYSINPDLPATDYSVVGVDVLRASTTATTALALGRELYVAKDADDAFRVGGTLDTPLYVGELGGHVPYGFDLTNSPVQIQALTTIPAGFFTDAHRPLVLVSSSGIPLLISAHAHEAAYIACLRNYTAVADHLAGRHEKIAIIGAGTRGEFRPEDQIGCAWLGEELVKRGYEPENSSTAGLVSRWSGANVEIIKASASAEYLRRSGQLHDLEFVLHHVDDVSVVPKLTGRKVQDAHVAS